MATLLDSTEKIETFKCQNCGQFTSLEAGNCKFCKMPVDLEAAKAYEQEETAKLKSKLREDNKSLATKGIVLLLLGCGISLTNYLLAAAIGVVSGKIFLIGLGLILLGAGCFIS